MPVRHGMTTGELARLFNDAGLISICSFVSPHRDDRERARALVGEGRFLEIHLAAPLEACREREPELYDKADRGELRLFSGVSSPYESPTSPELELPTHELDVEACLERILELLRERGVLSE